MTLAYQISSFFARCGRQKEHDHWQSCFDFSGLGNRKWPLKVLLPQFHLDAQVSLCGNIFCVSSTSVSSID